MKKIILALLTLALSATFLHAGSFKNKKDKLAIQKYVNKSIQDTTLKLVTIEEISGSSLEDGNWSQYLVRITVEDSISKESRISTNIFFTNGLFVSSRLYSVNFNSHLEKMLAPKPTKEDETESRRILGNSLSSHTIYIFSDPRCPSCKGVVPGLIEKIQEVNSTDISVFLVDTALPMHPSSQTIIRIIAAESLSGNHLRALNLYNLKISETTSPFEILEKSNVLLGTKYTFEELTSDKVNTFLKGNEKLLSDKMIVGTPSIYLDGQFLETLSPINDLLKDSNKSTSDIH